MTPQIIRGFFNLPLFESIKAHVSGIANRLEATPPDDLKFNRHTVHNEPELVRIHKDMEPWLSGVLGRPVKKSYVFLSIYRKDGICPRHVDRPQCQYTVDVCISQVWPWKIYVDDLPYELRENEALLYSGTGSPHYRQRMKEGNHCHLIFFHFVSIDYEGSLD
jgi:hypothetical protein